MSQMVSELYKTAKVLERLMGVARLPRGIELDQLLEARMERRVAVTDLSQKILRQGSIVRRANRQTRCEFGQVGLYRRATHQDTSRHRTRHAIGISEALRRVSSLGAFTGFGTEYKTEADDDAGTRIGHRGRCLTDRA